MWFYQDVKLNIWATEQKSTVAQNLQNKAYTNNHNYCRKHRKFCILHNRNHPIQNCEKFSPIVRQNWHFLKCHGYCYTNKCKLLLC